MQSARLNARVSCEFGDTQGLGMGLTNAIDNLAQGRRDGLQTGFRFSTGMSQSHDADDFIVHIHDGHLISAIPFKLFRMNEERLNVVQQRLTCGHDPPVVLAHCSGDLRWVKVKICEANQFFFPRKSRPSEKSPVGGHESARRILYKKLNVLDFIQQTPDL